MINRHLNFSGSIKKAMNPLFSLIFCLSTYTTFSQSFSEIISAVSADRIENDIKKLVSFGTRHTMSETESDRGGIGAARRWIKSEFEKISKDCGSCLEVLMQ